MKQSPEFDLQRPLQSATEIVKAIFLNPKGFYRGFSVEGSLREPAVFVLLVSAVAGVLRALVVFVLALILGELSPFTLGTTLVEVVLFVALSPLAVGVAAAVYLLSIRTFLGPVAKLREVYRMLAYAYGVMVLAWIPVVEAFVITYALMVLMLLGIRSVYRTSLMTATVTALVAYVPLMSLLIGLRVAVAALVAG